MQEYEVKRGLIKNVDLKGLFEAHFGDAREEEGWIVGQFGTMDVIKVRYEKQTLVVDTHSDKALAKKIAEGDQQTMQLFQDTHKRWNTFLLDATGYDAKMRSKKAQEKAKKAAA